jgi:hypothetical protein
VGFVGRRTAPLGSRSTPPDNPANEEFWELIWNLRKLTIFKHYDIGKNIHSSRDEQKYRPKSIHLILVIHLNTLVLEKNLLNDGCQP